MQTRRAKARMGLAETCGWLLLAFVLAPPSACGQTLPPGQAIPLCVQDNRCQCILPTPKPDDKFFLILGSASLGAGPYRVTIQTDGIEETSVPAANSASKTSGVLVTSAKKKQQEATETTENTKSSSLVPPFPPIPVSRPRNEEFSESDYPPADEPPRTRNFFLFVKERDFYSADSYVT